MCPSHQVPVVLARKGRDREEGEMVSSRPRGEAALSWEQKTAKACRSQDSELNCIFLFCKGQTWRGPSRTLVQWVGVSVGGRWVRESGMGHAYRLTQIRNESYHPHDFNFQPLFSHHLISSGTPCGLILRPVWLQSLNSDSQYGVGDSGGLPPPPRSAREFFGRRQDSAITTISSLPYSNRVVMDPSWLATLSDCWPASSAHYLMGTQEDFSWMWK